MGVGIMALSMASRQVQLCCPSSLLLMPTSSWQSLPLPPTKTTRYSQSLSLHLAMLAGHICLVSQIALFLLLRAQGCCSSLALTAACSHRRLFSPPSALTVAIPPPRCNTIQHLRFISGSALDSACPTPHVPPHLLWIRFLHILPYCVFEAGSIQLPSGVEHL